MNLRPLSARSTLLSLLLGSHPPELPTPALVAAGEYFGIAQSAVRAALSRMTAAGDIARTDIGYRLAPRLSQRQQRQDLALDPTRLPWDGTWEQVVIIASGRDSAARAALRHQLSSLRLGELREGVWMRPANLQRPLPQWSPGLVLPLTGTHLPTDSARSLAARLWDLTAWREHAEALLDALAESVEPARRLALGAAIVRHLQTDPNLPEELVEDGGDPWPGPRLRARYAAYQEELRRVIAEVAAPA